MEAGERDGVGTAVTPPVRAAGPATPGAVQVDGAGPPSPDGVPDTVAARSGPATWHRLGRALAPAGVYLAVRLVGVAVLGLMAAARGNAVLAELRSWDGLWMLSIAGGGYAGVPTTLVDAFGRHTATTAYAFFPGYPAAVAVAGLLTGGDLLVVALLVSAAAGIAAAYGLTALAAAVVQRRRDAGAPPVDPHRVGLLLVALFAAAPMGVVLSMAYTEALFCALAVWALVGALRERWLLAGVCTAAAGLVRPTGSALVLAVGLAAAVAAADALRPQGDDDGTGPEPARPHRAASGPVLAVLLAPAGLLAYLGFVGWRTGSPTGWFAIQSAGWGSQLDGGASLAAFVARVLVDGHELFDMAVLLALAGSLTLLAVAVRTRLPWPLLVYAAAVLATVWLSDGQTHSRVRLLVPAFPLLIPVAVGLARRRPATAVAVVVAAALASAWFGGYALTIWRYAI